MKNPHFRRPSPAMLVALTALFISLGGVSYGVATGSIDSREIKNNTIRTGDIRNNEVRGKDIRNSTIRTEDIGANQVKGADVLESSLGVVPAANAANVANFATRSATVDKLKTVGSYRKATSSASNADEATARAAATEVPLIAGIGPVSLYGKCFVDTDAGPGATPQTRAEIYTRTSQNGVIQEGDDDLPGNPFLDTTTAEDARQLDTETTNQNTATVNETEFVLHSPDGRGFNGLTGISVKNGTLPGGNGPYGAGDVCLFSAAVLG
jgi:hypothetical protein